MSTVRSPRGDTLPMLVDLSSLTDDLTGSIFFITVKKNITDPDAQALFAAEHTCTNNNNFFFTIPASVAATVDVNSTYIADVQRKAVDGSIESWPPTKFKFKPDVTLRTS